MSRSRKHSPGGTIAVCKSQKQGKKASELTGQWDLGGDGKQYWVKHDKKWMRK